MLLVNYLVIICVQCCLCVKMDQWFDSDDALLETVNCF